jgi:uncharacterized protein YcbK (DUF882 family)
MPERTTDTTTGSRRAAVVCLAALPFFLLPFQGERVVFGAPGGKQEPDRKKEGKIQTAKKLKEKGKEKDKGVKKKGKGGSDKVIVWLRVGEVTSGGVSVVVQPFQRLQDIAGAYGVSMQDILKANNDISPNMIKAGQKLFIPGATSVRAVKTFVPADKLDQLEGFGPQIEGGGSKPSKKEGKEGKEPEGVVSGKVVKAGVLHTVMPGQTLWDISKAYKKKIDAILKANGLKDPSSIKIGARILIPEAKQAVPVPSSAKNLFYLQPVTFQRIHTGETRSLNLFTPMGKIKPSHYKIFQKLMFDHRTNKEHKIHSRLVSLIVKVAAHFEFKTVFIYSGFRAYNPQQYTKESKHNVGRAIDFAIGGVSNKNLMSYCRTLGNVGVGYYPNSYFVHLDVREEPAFWVDYSGPGQKPKYGKLKA